MEVLVPEPLEEVPIGPSNLDRKIQISSALDPELRGKLLALISANHDCFAWSHVDMIGIDEGIIIHKLGVDPKAKPIKQRRRKFAPEWHLIINEEVQNLLKNGMVREVKYPDWLANVVVVRKKNGKWRMWVWTTLI